MTPVLGCAQKARLLTNNGSRLWVPAYVTSCAALDDRHPRCAALDERPPLIVAEALMIGDRQAFATDVRTAWPLLEQPA